MRTSTQPDPIGPPPKFHELRDNLPRRRDPSQICLPVTPPRPAPTTSSRPRKEIEPACSCWQTRLTLSSVVTPTATLTPLEIASPTGTPIATLEIDNDEPGFAQALAWIVTHA